MRKVLIISPRFPPVSTPDSQRVRMSLPYFHEFGWEPTVLCVTPESSDGIYDPLIAQTVPQDVRIVRVPAWSERRCRKFGFGHLDYRCLVPLLRAGSRLLQKGDVDLVFFSTTVFTTFLLARIWKRRFGCRVVFDFQDPWFAGTLAVYDRSTAPGGWIKYRMSQRLASLMERLAMRSVDYVISVSDGYVRALRASYPWCKPEQFGVIPFGAPEEDFKLVSTLPIQQSIFNLSDGLRHVVYVGRGGPDMNPVLEVLFRSLAQLRADDSAKWNKFRLHFVGTNYSPNDRTFKVVEPLARKYNVADLVTEHSERIPYFAALKLLCDSDAVLLIGSATSDYTASKLFPCLLSGRPVLALFHSQSLISQLASAFSGVRLVGFNASPTEDEFTRGVREGLEWVESETPTAGFKRPNLRLFSARELTRQMCDIFDRIANQSVALPATLAEQQAALSKSIAAD